MLNKYFNMKKGVMLFVVVVFFASFVNAGLGEVGECRLTSGSCISSEEQVGNLYFSSEDNAHVCYDTNTNCYDFHLCCPSDGEEVMNFQTGFPGFGVVSIYSTYNSHIAENYIYPISLSLSNVGSGGCEIVSSCDAGDICLFSMYDENSHVSECGIYPKDLCCEPDEVVISGVCTDNDGDGYGVCPDCGVSNGCLYEGHDCDDSDPDINPGATEICDDGIDQDCSGEDLPCETGTYLGCVGGTCAMLSGDLPDQCDFVGQACGGSGEDCLLTNAYWEVDGSDDVVPEGREVTLTVDGNTYCVGDVTFDIAEVDCVIGCDYDDIDQEDTDELNVKQVTATFSGGDAVATWTAEWVQDDGGWDDDPEYYFKATWSPDFRADSDELKVEAGVCGDGLVNQDLEECDIDDLGEEEDCESYLGTNWEGLLGCYEAGDDNECEYNTDQCDDDDSNPDDTEGTFRQWGECIDDGDGDNIGTREVYLYSSETGMQVCGWGGADDCVFAIEECLLGEEEIPFF